MNILVKLGIWCLPLCLFAGLLWAYLIPSGEKTISLEMGQVSPYIQRLLPDARVSELKTRAGDDYVEIIDEPVYFTVIRPAGGFEQVELEIAFDPAATPTFELGALRDVAAQAFEFKPLANLMLEQLAWTRHELGDGSVLFSRSGSSQAHKTFLETPPDRSTVATYRASFPQPFRFKTYTPSPVAQTFVVSLRGPHELLTYVKNEDFNFNVSYSDVNRTYGADPGFIKVYDEHNQLMTEVEFKDDGNIYDNQEPTRERQVSVNGRAWPEGVYRIVLSGTSDIIWRSLTTSQKYLVIKNRVFLGDEVGYAVSPSSASLFTNAARITAETQHREGLQTLLLADTPLAIEQVGTKYSGQIPGSGMREVIAPLGDIKITGEGKYALSASSFFDPDPIALTPYTPLENSQLNFVLADLSPVLESEGWRVASAEFELAELAMENGAYKFALSVPGVHEPDAQVAVHKIQVTFTRPPLTVREFVRQVRHLIKLLLT